LNHSVAPPKIRALIISLIVLLVIALVWLVRSITGYVTTTTTGKITFTIVPANAKLLVDNKTQSTSDTLNLTPGSHTITFSSNGFASKTITVNVGANQQSSQTVILIANGSAGLVYLNSHPSQQQTGESISGAEANSVGKKITEDNPLIALLPYQGGDFSIDVGVSQKYPSNPDAVAIYITASGQTAQTHALNWIKAQGYNPAAYEIIYESGNSGQ
jgi:hypothetical protein